MIPDYEKNRVAFTKVLCDTEKYGGVAADLKKAFGEFSINVDVLEHCKDIWCRDFMPIQVGAKDFVQFIYDPSYLRTPKEKKTITDPRLAYPDWLADLNPEAIPIVLDGGSVVGNHEVAFISEQVIKDNPDWSDCDLLHGLCDALRVKQLVWVRTNPEDFTGHVDGTARIVADRRAIVSHPGKKSPIEIKRYAESVRDFIEDVGFSVQSIPDVSYQNDGDEDACGCFANFVQLGGVIVLPSFKTYKSEEEKAIALLTEQGFRLREVECDEVARGGGALNCVTWTFRCR